MVKSPVFTHTELMHLWHAISQYCDNSRMPEEALSVREKLDDYVLACNVSKPVKKNPTVHPQDIIVNNPVEKDVHTEHCTLRGCKYGEEDTCSVVTGRKPASYPDSDFDC